MNVTTLTEHLISSIKFRGGSVCIQTVDSEITFSEIVNKIESAASYLRFQGINQGDRVVIVIENSIDYVIALYSIWRISAIAVPLNPQSTLHEIENVIKQCKPNALIIENVTADMHVALNYNNLLLISLIECKFNNVKNWSDALNNKNIINYEIPDNSLPAQIIYTSGTTGNPKGVVLTHENLMINTLDIVKYLKLTDKDSVLNALPFHYSYGNSVLHTHLYAGAKITLAGLMAFPQEIVNDLRKYRSSGFYGVPSTYSLLLSRSDWDKNPPPLRYLTQAGGPMSVTLTNKLLDSINSNTELFIMYGQTEATARISWLPPEYIASKKGSVGIALESIKIEIRDKTGKKLKSNITGNVFVSGKSIMKGYWNNDTATNETIINGWLSTGDTGHLDVDNFLFLEGRINDMIKVGAHRINPLELEEVINKLDFIDESAVIGVDDEILGQKLRAYVVGSESKNNLFSLKKHCSENLPAHKIPRDVKWIAEIPKTSSGKIKRFELN